MVKLKNKKPLQVVNLGRWDNIFINGNSEGVVTYESIEPRHTWLYLAERRRLYNLAARNFDDHLRDHWLYKKHEAFDCNCLYDDERFKRLKVTQHPKHAWNVRVAQMPKLMAMTKPLSENEPPTELDIRVREVKIQQHYVQDGIRVLTVRAGFDPHTETWHRAGRADYLYRGPHFSFKTRPMWWEEPDCDFGKAA